MNYLWNESLGIMYIILGKIICFKWVDIKDVYFASTCHGTEITTKTIRNEQVSKPEATWEYNSSMSNADRSDQGMSFYHITRKRCRKYYHKIFKHLLEQMIQ